VNHPVEITHGQIGKLPRRHATKGGMCQRIALPLGFEHRIAGLPVTDPESLKFYPEKLYHHCSSIEDRNLHDPEFIHS